MLAHASYRGQLDLLRARWQLLLYHRIHWTTTS
jgi:hypothetical protein